MVICCQAVIWNLSTWWVAWDTMHYHIAVNCHRNAQLNCALITFALTIITIFWSVSKGSKSFRSRESNIDNAFQKLVRTTTESGNGFLCFSLQVSPKAPENKSDSNFVKWQKKQTHIFATHKLLITLNYHYYINMLVYCSNLYFVQSPQTFILS